MRQGERYAAKLLFRFRGPQRPGPRARELCEERIVVFQARSDAEALRKARSRGKRSGVNYRNTDNERVIFEFVGILDLRKIEVLCEKDEVWYDIKRLTRKAQAIPSVSKLLRRT